jgi:hypothetical protein
LGVLPGFGYYADGLKKNAYATPLRRLTRSDGTVLFGLNFLKEALAAAEHPAVGVSAICAHEFGHILQYKRGLVRILAPNNVVRRIELHADFLSGYFAGTRKREKPDYPAAVFATKAYSIGDTAFDEAQHHGTPDERADAVVHGFQSAYRDRKTLDEAVQIGVNYVSKL